MVAPGLSTSDTAILAALLARKANKNALSSEENTILADLLARQSAAGSGNDNSGFSPPVANRQTKRKAAQTNKARGASPTESAPKNKDDKYKAQRTRPPAPNAGSLDTAELTKAVLVTAGEE